MKKLIFILFILIFTSSASAAIYRWVDEKGVVNFADDASKIPSAYRDKVEEVNIAKMGGLIPSQTPPGNVAVNAQPKETGTKVPPVAQTLIREGDFAVKLTEILKTGKARNEAEAESLLATVGIAPKNGWIADYPVTPDIIGELQNAVRSTADSGKLGMSKDEAVKAIQDLAAQQGLPVNVDEEQNPGEPPQGYAESDAVNDYYYTEGPPVVTYYPPPWDYNYLYGWVPYPFWYTGFWFPGFFILTDFHLHHGHHWITNHYVDPATHTSHTVDPTTRATGTAATRNSGQTGSSAFASSAARRGATSILNRSANSRTLSQASNTAGRQYQSSLRQSPSSGRSIGSSSRAFSTPSIRSFSTVSSAGRSSYGSSRGGSYSGSSHGGSGTGGSHVGGRGGGRR